MYALLHHPNIPSIPTRRSADLRDDERFDSEVPLDDRRHRRHREKTESDAAKPLLGIARAPVRAEEHTSELQSHSDLVCRLLLEKRITCSPCTATAKRLIRCTGY